MVRNKIIVSLLFIVIINLTFYSIPSSTNQYNLIFYCMESRNETVKIGELVFSVPIEMNLSFVHSVHKTPIYDIIIVNKTGFYGIEHWTQQFGAGEPETLEDAGAKELLYNSSTGFFIYKDMDRYLGATLYLPLRTSINMTLTIQLNSHAKTFQKQTCDGMLIVKEYSKQK